MKNLIRLFLYSALILSFNVSASSLGRLEFGEDDNYVDRDNPLPASGDFFFDVARNLIPDHTANNISAHSSDVTTTIKTIGAYGAGQLYVYPTSATIDCLSSNSASDTHEITIIGLDSTWDKAVQVETLTGTTPVSITTKLIRVNHFLNNSSSASAGTIFLWDSPSGNCTEHTAGVPTAGSTVKAFIAITIGGGTISDEHHLSTVFTVPAGKDAYIVFGKTTVSDAKALELTFWARKFGGVFLLTHHIDIKNNNYDYFFKLPGHLDEKTDVEVRATVDAGTAEVSAHYDVIAVDKSAN